MKPKSSTGITLIEFLIVLLAIGLLAAIAIPSYQDYTIRAQVSEGLNLAGPVRASVAKYYAESKILPADNEAAGAEPAAQIRGKYVTSVEVLGGAVIVTYGADAHSIISGATVSLLPTESDNSELTWDCESRAIPEKHLPTVCR